VSRTLTKLLKACASKGSVERRDTAIIRLFADTRIRRNSSLRCESQTLTLITRLSMSWEWGVARRRKRLVARRGSGPYMLHADPTLPRGVLVDALNGFSRPQRENDFVLATCSGYLLKGIYGLIHNETCAGCTVAWITAVISEVRLSRSTSPRSFAEKSAIVCSASYLLR
jgi:hypothetical protein